MLIGYVIFFFAEVSLALIAAGAVLMNMETRELLVAKAKTVVIATGGGFVTREENYPFLHGNGIIVWVQRPLAQLPTEGRPLSQRDSLAQMCAKRKPLYETFADAVVWNNQAPSDAVKEILKGRTV